MTLLEEYIFFKVNKKEIERDAINLNNLVPPHTFHFIHPTPALKTTKFHHQITFI